MIISAILKKKNYSQEYALLYSEFNLSYSKA